MCYYHGKQNVFKEGEIMKYSVMVEYALHSLVYLIDVPKMKV